MRELFVVDHESTETSLVLRTDDGEEFFLAVDDSLRASLTSGAPKKDATTGTATEDATTEDATTDLTDATAENISAEDSTDSETAATDSKPDPAATTDTGAAADATAAAHTPLHLAGQTTGQVPSQQRRPLVDAMSMRPAEIQNRVRAGASAAELADEMGVAESRVEPFAYPVILERTRIAELAKQAHPVRDDGPAKLTLFEILATAFAARGHTLSEASWDAYRRQGEPWIIRLTWSAGLSENEAEWTLKQSMSSAATVEARNAVAADLTDPDFVQPVRSLTSIGTGRSTRFERALSTEEPDYGDDFYDGETDERGEADRPTHGTAAGANAGGALTGTANTSADDADATNATDQTNATDATGQADATHEAAKAGNAADFFQNPDPEPKPTKRRRKAVTPHWEDVLLGVRANTKRPRS